MDLVTARGRALPFALTALAMLVAWRASTAAAYGAYLPAYAVIVGLVGALVVARPRVAVLGVVALGATVLPDRAGSVAIAGVRTDITEALAFMVIATWLVYAGLGRVPRPRFAVPLLVLQAGHLVGLFVGAANGAQQADLLGFGKAFAFYLLPLVLTAFFVTAEQQDLLARWVIRLCTAGSVITVAAAATGLPLGSGARTTVVETLDATFEAQRIRTPLLALLVLGILITLGRVLDQRLTRGDAGRLALYSVAVILSFNRSTWAPLVLAAILLAFLRRGPRQSGRGIRFALVGGAAVTVLFTAAAGGVLGPTAAAAADRVGSTTDASVGDERSYADRVSENDDALRALSRSPLVGVGVSRPYGARRPFYLTDPPRVVYADRLFIHNSYLGIWLQLGLLGLAAVLLLGVAVARESMRAARVPPPARSTRHIAAGLALLVFGLQALLQTSLTHRPTIIATAVALALLQRPRDPVTPT